MVSYTLTQHGASNKPEAIKELRAIGLSMKEALDAYASMLTGTPFETTANLPPTLFAYHYAKTTKTGEWMDTVPTVPPTKPAPVVETKPKSSGIAGAIEEIVNDAVGHIIDQKVKAMINEALAGTLYPTRVVLEQPKLPEIDLGLTHKTFPKLLKAANAKSVDGHRLNVWLAGPAGTGKTTAAKMLGKAFDCPVTVIGTSDNKYEVTGFVNAHGQIVDTEFKKAYTSPKAVICIDEVDGWFPNALLALNAALANGFAPFPEGMLKRGEDVVIICCANTYGQGSTEYVGRMKQDAAFLDRFVFIQWDIDEALEMALCTNRDWCRRVQGVRKRAAGKGKAVGTLITPRATIYGDALLAAGFDMEDVEAMVLRKGMTEEVWNSIK